MISVQLLKRKEYLIVMKIAVRTFLAEFMHCPNHKSLWCFLLFKDTFLSYVFGRNKVYYYHGTALITFRQCFPLSTYNLIYF